MNFKMEKEKINWDELKKKVDDDIQKDIDNEIQTIKDINTNLGDDNRILNLKTTDIDIDPFNLWAGVDIEEKDKNEELDEDEIDDENFEEEVDETDEDEERDENYSSCFCDYCDQGGLIDPHSEIEKYAWNNAEKKSDIECIHLSSKEKINTYDDDVYIYPINKEQDICLCRDCNRELASKIMEQMALEMFI